MRRGREEKRRRRGATLVLIRSDVTGWLAGCSIPWNPFFVKVCLYLVWSGLSVSLLQGGSSVQFSSVQMLPTVGVASCLFCCPPALHTCTQNGPDGAQGPETKALKCWQSIHHRMRSTTLPCLQGGFQKMYRYESATSPSSTASGRITLSANRCRRQVGVCWAAARLGTPQRRHRRHTPLRPAKRDTMCTLTLGRYV